MGSNLKKKKKKVNKSVLSEHQQGYDIKDVCQDGLKVASRQKQCTEYKMYYYIYIYFLRGGF